ncbi:MAG TPA: acyl-CoA dehydrogenase family protein [Spirochaetota bacterium]|nr:acyl-CoA dehydrogenase family protein [Spirochaetota bacterium]HPV40982.1 acyl-CoA dehydrogenase family protein [Spirochaetota bacterium]
MEFGFTEEQLMFRDTVYRFAKKEIAPLVEQADLKSEFSKEIWGKLGGMGLLGLPFPEELGGGGADVVTCCLSGEALGHAGVDQGHLLALGAHTYLCTDTLYKNGNDAQRKKYVPKLASGEWIGCMGLTEPGAGSDAGSLQTSAVKKGDKWILNGSKTFITNAPVCDVCVVYATVDKKLKQNGITAFIVEKGFKGFSTGEPFHKMGVRASTTSEVFLDNCEVPEENLLGEVGKGMAYTHETLSWDRSALLAPFIGGMQFAIEECTKYSQERVQFEKPINTFQAIQHKLADLKIIKEAAKMVVYRVAHDKDTGKPLNHMHTSIAKAVVGDWGLKAASEAVQVFGGYGFIHDYPIERFLRDAKLAQIGGGTSEIQRFIISRILSMF